MMQAEKRLAALGMKLPDLKEDYARDSSDAKFISHLAHGDLLYLSGTAPRRDGRPYLTGVVGDDLTVEQGYEAARYAALTSLSVLKYALQDLDRMAQVVQMLGYVNSSPDFAEPPRVINGATDLLAEVYGRRGVGSRLAVGCQGIADNSSVEIVLTVAFEGDATSEPLQTIALDDVNIVEETPTA